ncbi:MAG: FumA C-terminus/TtdB family hydratase beta subunit [Bullifex sp.]
MMVKLELPYKKGELEKIKAGDTVSVSGILYVGRDQVHKRLYDAVLNGDELPFEFEGNGIYYMGPSPAAEGHVMGSCGPTTSARMDPFSPLLTEKGLRLMIGKGPRKPPVLEAVRKYGGLYLQAFGGCGALYSSCITSCETVAYPELGPEALLRLTVKDFPAIAVADSSGQVLTADGIRVLF